MTRFVATNAACNLTLARSWLALAEARGDDRAAGLLLALIGRWQDRRDGVRRDGFVMRLADRIYRAHCVIAKLAERKGVRAK